MDPWAKEGLRVEGFRALRWQTEDLRCSVSDSAGLLLKVILRVYIYLNPLCYESPLG